MRVAAVQTDPELGRLERNLAGIEAAIERAEADLVVFPESALSGYGFQDRVAVVACAQTIPGPAVDRVADVCRRTGAHAIFGLFERDGDRLFNSAAVVGPAGLIGRYRKSHLPFLGADRFVDPGDLGYPVFETPVGRLGVLICYDMSFPETSRSLKLDGAQVICVITNWPMAAAVSCVHAPPVRAQENHVFLVISDRVGEESGFRFRGESRILDCDGKTLAEGGTEPTIVRASIEPEVADRNRVINVPGQYEIDRIAHRRPETYHRVVDVPVRDGGDRKRSAAAEP